MDETLHGSEPQFPPRSWSRSIPQHRGESAVWVSWARAHTELGGRRPSVKESGCRWSRQRRFPESRRPCTGDAEKPGGTAPPPTPRGSCCPGGGGGVRPPRGAAGGARAGGRGEASSPLPAPGCRRARAFQNLRAPGGRLGTHLLSDSSLFCVLFLSGLQYPELLDTLGPISP